MTNFNNLFIVLTFFGLWIGNLFSQEVQLILGFILILSFGIMHGANDILLLKKMEISNDNNFKIILFYIITVLLGGFLFYIFPSLILLLFILVSGYHFGEQEWYEKLHGNTKIVKIIFQFLYGSLVLNMLFYLHLIEVRAIIIDISKNLFLSKTFMQSILIVNSALLLGLMLLLFLTKKITLYNVLRSVLLLVLYFVIFYISSLIWSFAIYFVIWHSLPSILDQIKFLYGTINSKNIKKYYLSGVLYWIAAIVSIFGITFLIKDNHLFNSIFFTLLSSITFPHIFVVMYMYKRKK